MGGFDEGIRSGDIPATPEEQGHALHCDGLESDPTSWTLSDAPTEIWYCYDSGVPGSDDLVDVGWDDDGDRVTGDVVPDEQGAAILRPLRAIGDSEAYGAAWTWLDSDWDWGGGVAYTVTADHVLLADAWVRSEGLLGDVSVQVEDCGSGGPPYTVGGVACQNAAFSNTRNSVFDGSFDGIAGPAWYPVNTWTIAGQDYESIRLWFESRHRWHDLALGPTWWLDDVWVREYPTSGPDGFKFRAWYGHREYARRSLAAYADWWDSVPTAFVDDTWTTQVTLDVDHFAFDAAGGYNGGSEGYCGALLLTLPAGVSLARVARSPSALSVTGTSTETWLLQYGTDYDDTTETLTCDAHSDYSLPASAGSEAGARFEWLKLQLAPSVSCPDGECGTLRVQPLWFMDADPLDGVPALADPRPAAIPGDDLATVMALYVGVGPVEEDLLIDVRQLATTGVGVQPVKLQADLGGVDNGVAQRRWPGYLDLADHVGADGVTLGTSDIYAWSAGNVDPDAHPVDPGHGCADDCSAECEATCDPDLPGYNSEECALCNAARWRNEGWGLFPTEVIGAKAEIYGFSSWLGPWDDDPGDSYYEGYEAGTGLAKEEMCVAGVTDPDFDMANTWARTGKELDRIANAARLGLSQVLFDFEPDSAVFCPALQDQWDREWRGDLIATSPGLECTAAVEAEALDSTYTACDGALKDLLREDGHALWSEVYTTLQTGGQEFVTVHPTDRHDPTHPEIGNWRSGPGRFHNGSDGYADVDVLYPQVLSYSMPLIGDYDEETDVTLLRNLLDPGDTGLLVRRDLIGMMALGGTNLLPVTASGFEPDLMEFDFSDRFCDPLGAEGTPEGVVFGPLTDSPELWWNCLVLPGFASESGQAARGFGALTIQPSGYWACSDGDEPQFGEAGCECWPNGAVACEIEGNDTDFGDAFLVGADALGNTPVEPGELYVATVSSRYDLGPDALTPSNARPGLVLVWHKSDGSLAGFSGSDSGVGFRSGVWSNIAVVDYAPVNAASVSVGLYAAGVDGHAWFDDVVLAKASLVSNGRMLTAPGTLPSGFGMWIDAGYPVFVEKVSSATGPTHRTSMVESATDHAVQVKWKPGGTGRGGVSQVVDLPPRKVDGFGFAGPFQVSAWFRPSAAGAVPILRVAWWRDGEPAPDPHVSCPASECGALGTVGEWTQVSYSLRAPDDAVAATVYAGAEVASGLVHVDDVDLRVDGPYVVPWMNAGYSRDKGLPTAEIPNSHFHDLLLASFVAGAQRTANNGPAWVDGKDVDEMGSVMAMLSGTGSTDARQRIVADGLPLTGNHLRVLSGIPGRADRAFGMEYDDRLLISVTSLGVADPTHEVMVELKRHQCDLSEVERDGSIGTFLGSVGPAGGTVALTYTDDDPYRTHLVYGECQSF